jgi:hypothetical protein
MEWLTPRGGQNCLFWTGDEGTLLYHNRRPSKERVVERALWALLVGKSKLGEARTGGELPGTPKMKLRL